MDPRTAKVIIEKAGLKIEAECRLGNNTGTQLRLNSGQLVNIYDTGNFSVQGKNPDSVRKLLEEVQGTERPAISNKIFVVYGHDSQAREQLELILRRWKLEPMILDQLPSEGKTIIEKLENYTENIGFAVVLATPDDEGHRRDYPDEKTFRVRQNVVLELGMMLNRLGRSRVAILIKNPDQMERPSDIQGLIYIPFKDHVKEAQIQLAKEMCAQGYRIDIDGLV